MGLRRGHGPDDPCGGSEPSRSQYDPADAAADADSDGLDNLGEQAAGTDPLDADTDGDGSSDGDEILAGTDPLDDQSFPPPAVPSLSLGSTLLLIALLAGIPARRLRRVD